jgi:hypothetical protein
MPSTSGYLVVAGASAAVALFLVLLLIGGDEAAWVPAGLTASVVMLIAVAAREIVTRRAWTRHLLRQTGGPEHSQSHKKARRHIDPRSVKSQSSALRAVQKQSSEADVSALPETHLEAYYLCKEYLANIDEALRSSSILTENRLAMRAGQDRVRALQRHHMLSWARGASRALTHEATLRTRISDKVEAAMRALDVIDMARKLYPEDAELQESDGAVREFLASIKVAHWVELAERAAFRGQCRRAIDRYRDALFYVSRESMREEVRIEMAQRIDREIDILRARLKEGDRKNIPRSQAPQDSSGRGTEDDQTEVSQV